MKTVTVSNVRQLRRAIRNPKVERIDVVPGTYRMRKAANAGRPAIAAPLFIDGHGATFVIPAAKPGTYVPKRKAESPRR